jgi:hypothetical protein
MFRRLLQAQAADKKQGHSRDIMDAKCIKGITLDSAVSWLGYITPTPNRNLIGSAVPI